MTTVIRNSSHGNGISVIALTNLGLIRKICYTQNGRFYIEREISGLNWYDIQTGSTKDSIAEILLGASVSKVDMQRLSGKSIDYTLKLEVTNKIIQKTIAHYSSVWPSTNVVPLHGDLTLSNILVDGEKIHIIDWEHFCVDGELWGFDLAYLVLSALLLPVGLNINLLDDKSKKIFSSLWAKLRQYGIDDALAHHPLAYMKQKFKNSKSWARIINDSPRKMFPLLLSEKDTLEIDKLATGSNIDS